MKSIENFTVLNTWALLVDFLSELWFIVTATSTEIFIRAFKVSWRFCDTVNESAGYKESFETELPKLPCHKAINQCSLRKSTSKAQVFKTVKFSIA